MRKLGEWIDDPSTKHLHVIERVATLHSRFMAIFPWAKESGRTIRVASNLLLAGRRLPDRDRPLDRSPALLRVAARRSPRPDLALPRGGADHRRDRDARLRRGPEGPDEAAQQEVRRHRRRRRDAEVEACHARSRRHAAADHPRRRAGDRVRALGRPGGQNVNKVSSKVDLRWNPMTSAALRDDDRAWLLAAAAQPAHQRRHADRHLDGDARSDQEPRRRARASSR